jgi:hypothetical protein
MSDEEKSVAEIEAEYKKFLAKKTEILKAEIAAKEEEEKKEQEELAAKAKEEERREWLASELDRLGVNPNTGINQTEDNKVSTKELDKEVAFMIDYAKKQGIKKFASYEDIAEDYAANGVIAFTDSDSGCEDNVDAWERNDCFADVIWESVICHSDFLSKNITVRGLDFTEGCGGKVQLRVINVADPSSDFGSMSPCTCLSCVSNTFTTYTLTMEVYGDYKVLCDLDLFTAGSVVKKAVINSMKSRASERIDNKIYTELETNSPTYSKDLSAACGGSRGTDGLCCTYAVDLYDKIVDLEADMRAAGYFRDADPVLILSPQVAAYLKYKDGLNMPSYIAANIGMDGLKLARIGNIRVIESCHANSCTDAASEVMAILIDPTRAIGEAWGKRPVFKFDDDPIECGSQKVVLRMWADFAALDTAAIGHILNP